jgi:hypothetical protein
MNTKKKKKKEIKKLTSVVQSAANGNQGGDHQFKRCAK